MKPLFYAFFVAVALLTGCATSKTEVNQSGAVNDLVITSAQFGNGTHTADVTSRVIELLRSEPQGFSARADWLRVDPMPYHKKSLVVHYEYHGAKYQLLVPGQEKISYRLLLDNATK